MALESLPELRYYDIDDLLHNPDQDLVFGSVVFHPTVFSSVMEEYQDKDIALWQPMDVQQWLQDVYRRHSRDNVYIQNFQSVNGPMLLEMSWETFCNFDPFNGELIFRELCSLVQERSSKGGIPSASMGPSSPSYPSDYFPQGGPTYTPLQPRVINTAADNDHPACDIDYTYPGNDDNSGVLSSQSFCCLFPNQPEDDFPRSPASGPGCDFQPFETSPFDPYSPETPIDYPEPGTSQSSQRGERPSRKRGRGLKLFEFLWGLLNDPQCNPSIIRWECEQELSFRLVNQHEVARRWGERRPNNDGKVLPYEHFARAMRYYYKTGRLISVPEKKLVCKFGPEIYQLLRR